MASRSGRVLIETTDRAGGEVCDLNLDRFRSVWGPVWVPGRLTLTKLHLNFIPHRSGRGLAMLDVDLGEISSVELSRSLVSTQIGLRTGRHLTRIRLLRASELATTIARLAQTARTSPQTPTP